MNSKGKFSEQQSGQISHSEQAGEAREFSTPEDLLRFDAGNTAVPAGILERLAKSAEGLPHPKRPWWARLFGK
jgi:hypothetical protein